MKRLLAAIPVLALGCIAEHVIFEASTIGNARMMAESQYGKGSVVNVSHKR